MPSHPIDLSVLILFFNRPEALSQLWERIQLARPSRLFLYQDGPRHAADLEGITACRQIVEQIDWPCEVHRNYQEKNSGCDPSNYLSQKWAFEHTDSCVFFEDDDIPSLSFFPFCQQMLQRYAADPRVMLISGFNYDEQTPAIPYDYFFTSAFNINGFATWRRVFELYESSYQFLENAYDMEQLDYYIHRHRYQTNFLEFCRYHKRTGKPYYETLLHAAIFLHHGLSIVPRVNMVANLGACGQGVHLSGSNRTLPRAYRRIFEMKAHELEFPLRHPPYMLDNIAYKERMFRAQAWGHPWIKIARSLEELWLTLRYGEWKRILPAVKKRIGKLLGKAKWD